jgi:GAF domain-containing protein/HAMP domain-containing protein
MSQAIPAKTDQFRGKLARTMLGVLLPLSLVPLVILGVMAYTRSRQVLISQIRTTLVSINEQHQKNIDAWIETRQEKVAVFYVDPVYDEAIKTAANGADTTTPEFAEARRTILGHLEELNSTADLFSQFFLVSPDGIVLVSSNPTLEGISLVNSAYFDQLSAENNALAIYSPEPFYNSLAFIIARPHFDSDGTHLATFWLMTGFSRFETLFNDTNFLGIRNFVITDDESYVGVGPKIKEISSSPIIEPNPNMAEVLLSAERQNSNDVVEYTSFDGENVLSIYHPIPEFNIGVVTEIPTTDIISQLQNLPFFIVLITVTILIAGLLIWISVRRFVKPILEVATTAQYFAEGDWQNRAITNRKDEIGLLAYSFNQMADEISSLYRSLESQVITRTQQVRTAAEVAQIATSATNLDLLLKQTVKLIVERFGYYYAAVFMLDDYKEYAVLRESHSMAGGEVTHQNELRLRVGSGSIIGQVSSSNQPYVTADVSEDPHYMHLDELPDTRSEVGIPLSIGDDLLGVLDVQSHRLNDFEQDSIATLQTLANQIASAMQNIKLLEAARTDLQATSALYQASHFIAQSETPEEVYETLISTLEQVPFISALFQVEIDSITSLAIIDPSRNIKNLASRSFEISSDEVKAIFAESASVTIDESESTEILPLIFQNIFRELGCEIFTIFSISPDENLDALLVLGTGDASKFSKATLEPYHSMIDITQTALEKVHALGTIQQRLAELETISSVGQSISTETDLFTLYEIVHKQVVQVMGDINFLIALYHADNDTIEIPYLDEGAEISSIDPFPLGEGLTSIVIRTRQPLMIVEDTENRSKALGAIVTESGFAKSWLGVPLLLGGDPIGAIVVQDIEHEYRFNDDDLRLMLTIATQVAIAIRNARHIENSKQRAEQERQLYEITNNIRRSANMHAILKTVATEINVALGAQRTHINIAIGTDNTEIQDSIEVDEETRE